jgi:RNA polymerase sigma-70 factor (ECF subfamily)
MDHLRAEFERMLGELRPRLHRYCARMTGSVIDGEDVLQEALVKAVEAFPRAQPITHPEGWLFRIAHNAALDFLRRRAREEGLMAHDDVATVADTAGDADRRLATAASLQVLMGLPVVQRACVVLMDVLGYTLQEVGDILDLTVAAVKANLHRGRTRLRTLAVEPQTHRPPVVARATEARLRAYIDRFNARDFDAIRGLLAEEVRVDVVGRTRLKGRREAGTYFGNYAQAGDWKLAAGMVEGRTAALVSRTADAPATYFILLEWEGDRLCRIRDFRHAPYVMDGADLEPLPPIEGTQSRNAG